MLTKYNSQDAELLQQQRLQRFKSFVLSDEVLHKFGESVEAPDLKIIADGSCLILMGCDPSTAIRETNILLFQAFIILGTSRLEIRDADSRLLFAAELESKQIAQSGELMTELATERRVEFDLAPIATTPNVVTWNRIASITGEKEEELRSRLQTLGTPFYWDNDSWAVPHEMASELIRHFRFEQGEKEVAAMLTGGVEMQQPTQQSSGRKPQSKAEKTEKPEKLEFQPLKRGVMPTLEKYLAFVSSDETTQTEVLSNIVLENVKGKRHLTKILDSYTRSPEIEKPLRGEIQVAAKNLMAKRAKPTTVTEAGSETESLAESDDAATEENSEAE